MIDRAAKTAAANPEVSFNPVPHLDTKCLTKRFINTRFQSVWSTITTNTKLKSIKPHVNPWPIIKSDNRRDVRVLNRLRIGHTRLTHNFLLQTPHVLPQCQRCPDILTVRHLLLDCPGFANQRTKWCFPDTLDDLLGENVNIFNLTSFLKESNLYFEI